MEPKKTKLNDNKKEGTDVSSSAAYEVYESIENPELGIKKLRTFAEDLAEAKEKAGIKSEPPKEKKRGFFSSKSKKEVGGVGQIEKPEPRVDISKIEAKEESTKTLAPIEPAKDVVRPSREYIEQELAKSGIVTDDSLESNKHKREETSVPVIRTYKNDAAESIQEKGTSKISILAAEQKRKVAKKDFSNTFTGEQSAQKNIGLVLLSVLLIAGGVWGAFYFYNKSKVDDAPAVAVSKTILFTNNKIEADANNLSGEAFREKIQESKDLVNGRLNDLTEIELTDRGIFGESKISKDNLFKKFEGNVPGRLVRNLQKEYLIGVHSGEEESIFYIFKIDDFDTVFAGVLEWENIMHRDLYNEALGKTFEDIYLQNKDTRIQKDNFGNIKLIYSFPNSETLLVTETEEAFFEVFERLTVSNATQN